MTKRIRILDVPVDIITAEQALSKLKVFIEEDGCSLIVTPNSEIILNATKDPKLKELIENAEMVIPDGIGIVYASRIMGVPLTERVTGIDFLNKSLEYFEESGKKVFLMGSKPGVAEKAAEKMVEKHKNIKIAGTHHGYFKEDDEAEIVEKINQSGADFLCVALGSPKQELFVEKHKEKLKPKAAIGVGGSLDVWSGDLKRAPEFYQKHGLEWLYRFAQEPKRYKRMATLPVFMLKVIFQKKK